METKFTKQQLTLTEQMKKRKLYAIKNTLISEENHFCSFKSQLWPIN